MAHEEHETRGTACKWTHDQIMTMAESAVFNRWLAGEQPQTIAEIASEIGVSESTLRKHASEHAGCPKGCRVAVVGRACTDWPGSNAATVWVPSDDYLRQSMRRLIERVELSKHRAEMEARG